MECRVRKYSGVVQVFRIRHSSLLTGLYYDAQEILPFAIGDHRYNKANEKLSRFASKEVEVRALVEGQSIAKRAHAEEAGFVVSKS